MKARITILLEYDINPKDYPDGYTPEQMLVSDITVNNLLAPLNEQGLKISVVRSEVVQGKAQ